jgi:hypothetical protein
MTDPEKLKLVGQIGDKEQTYIESQLHCSQGKRSTFQQARNGLINIKDLGGAKRNLISILYDKT